MNPQANPLDQLRDIQLPNAIHSFELAPLWWVIIAMLLTVVLWLISRWIQKRKAMRLLKPAKQELLAISQLAADNHAIAQLSGLLKRICLLYFPKNEVASLSGVQWIDFLNQQSAQIIFDSNAKQIFSEIAYRPQQTLEKATWQHLISQCERMITTIISEHATTGKKASFSDPARLKS